MYAPDDVTDPTGPPDRPPRAVLVVAVAVAFVVPWATLFGGPAWWSTTVLPICAWLLMGASGVALVMGGGNVRRVGTALITGDALGVLLFFVSFVVTLMVTHGGETGGG